MGLENPPQISLNIKQAVNKGSAWRTQQHLFPYVNESSSNWTPEPDTRHSFIMSFSWNNLSQTQSGDALSFQQMQLGFTGGRKADLFFWMNENDLHWGAACI